MAAETQGERTQDTIYIFDKFQPESKSGAIRLYESTPSAEAMECEHVARLPADIDVSAGVGTMAIALDLRRGPAASLALGPNHPARFLEGVTALQVQRTQVRCGTDPYARAPQKSAVVELLGCPESFQRHAPFSPACTRLLVRVPGPAIVNPKRRQAFRRPAHRTIQAGTRVEHQMVDEAVFVVIFGQKECMRMIRIAQRRPCFIATG